MIPPDETGEDYTPSGERTYNERQEALNREGRATLAENEGIPGTGAKYDRATYQTGKRTFNIMMFGFALIGAFLIYKVFTTKTA